MAEEGKVAKGGRVEGAMHPTWTKTLLDQHLTLPPQTSSTHTLSVSVSLSLDDIYLTSRWGWHLGMWPGILPLVPLAHLARNCLLLRSARSVQRLPVWPTLHLYHSINQPINPTSFPATLPAFASVWPTRGSYKPPGAGGMAIARQLKGHHGKWRWSRLRLGWHLIRRPCTTPILPKLAWLDRFFAQAAFETSFRAITAPINRQVYHWHNPLDRPTPKRRFHFEPRTSYAAFVPFHTIRIQPRDELPLGSELCMLQGRGLGHYYLTLAANKASHTQKKGSDPVDFL
jgi:hypothetical protein